LIQAKRCGMSDYACYRRFPGDYTDLSGRKRADEERLNALGYGHRAFMHDHPVNPETIANLSES